MTNTYATLAPLGSTSPKDLFDNASNFDDAMNSPSPSFYDRFGNRRETWAGMEQAFASFLINSGYEFIGDYDSPGELTFTQPNQIMSKSGEYWRPGAALALPYATINNWVIDQPKFVSVGDAALRSDLATQGAAIVFGAQQTVSTIAALRALSSSSISTYAFVLGYYLPNGEGGGAYYRDQTDTTSPDNGFDIIVPADNGPRWKLSQGWGGTLLQAGAKGDGVTDDTSIFQIALDRCKGRRLVLDIGKTFYCAGITLDGSTYDNTEIVFDGWLKMKPDSGSSTFGGAWVGLLIKDCDGVKMNPRVDGNRASMTQREQIFCVGIAGASNVTIPTAEFSEIRGDGLYVGQSSWTSSGTIPTGIKAGRISASNSVDDGRNAVTINSVNGFNLDVLISTQVGALVNGFIQPGGIDIEPDFGYQICTNIRIGYADVTTAGTNGVGVFGKSISGIDANRDWNCFDISIEDCRILKTGISGSALTATQFTRCADIQVKGSLAYNSVRGQGPNHDYSQRVHAKWRLNNVTHAVLIGAADALNDFDIEVDVMNYNGSGVRVTQCSRGRIYGRVFGALLGSTAFGVQCHNQGRSGVTIADVAFEIDAPYDGNIARAFRNEPGNLVSFSAGTLVRGCDWSGYPSFATSNDAIVRTENVLGYTNTTAVPSGGSWFQGTFVRNDVPTSVANKTTIGWVRANSGANNILGTDWYPCVVTNS